MSVFVICLNEGLNLSQDGTLLIQDFFSKMYGQVHCLLPGYLNDHILQL